MYVVLLLTVIKKLDKLILKTFLWPFIATFFVTLFVLLTQIVWKYIDDLVGKGLDFGTIIKFVIYASATLVTLALPIAILLSSIMTFGKLGEDFELVAIKSAGISFTRFMRPLFFVSLLLCGVTFLFANYIIPVANLKFEILYSDIYHKSPAFDLKDGVFYNGLEGYSIKVAKKEKDKSTLRNVIIYERSTGPQANCIISEKGIMKVSDDKKFLEFRLINGNRYEEKGEVSYYNNNEFIRLSFKEYNKLFDLSQLDIRFTSDSNINRQSEMLNVKQLSKAIDSLQKFPTQLKKKAREDMLGYFNYYRVKDSVNEIPAKASYASFDKAIPDSLKRSVEERAIGTLNVLHNNILYTSNEYETKMKDIRLHMLEWHKKFSLSLACLVLFFIGAPLGAIIRKGGLGVPVLTAIIFFVIFHLLNTFGAKLVKENVMTPLMGTWLSIFVLTPLGLFMIFKASRDSNLMNKEFYYRAVKRISTGLSPMVRIFKKRSTTI
jgi:lipopolysaccharide export system permease protein